MPCHDASGKSSGEEERRGEHPRDGGAVMRKDDGQGRPGHSLFVAEGTFDMDVTLSTDLPHLQLAAAEAEASVAAAACTDCSSVSLSACLSVYLSISSRLYSAL